MSQPVKAGRLTEHEGQHLLRLVRRGNHETIRSAAPIMMASASGTTVSAIARLVAAYDDTVRDVIHAFNAEGLACLGPRRAGDQLSHTGQGPALILIEPMRGRAFLQHLGEPR